MGRREIKTSAVSALQSDIEAVVFSLGKSQLIWALLGFGMLSVLSHLTRYYPVRVDFRYCPEAQFMGVRIFLE